MPPVPHVTGGRSSPTQTVTTRYAFECPHCGERTVVDGTVRDLLVADGCVGCGRPVPFEAFTPR